MRLYLVQHAEAKSKQEDPARPLSKQGEKDIRRIAAYLKEHAEIQVKEILHSGKTRAEQTAQALAEKLAPPRGISKTEGLKALADVEIWAKRLSLAETDEDTMLVGHLPHLSRLTSRLVYGIEEREMVSFNPGGVLCLVKDEGGSWSVSWMLIPALV
jgi:phosphohistidine phosphatase